MPIVGSGWDLSSVFYNLAPSCFQFVPHIHGSGVSQRLRLSLNMEFKVLFLYLPHFWGFLHILQQLWLLQAFSPCFSTQRGDRTFSWLPSPHSFATTTSTAAASREEQQKTSHLLQMLTPLQNLSSLFESPKPSNRFSPLECISVI